MIEIEKTLKELYGEEIADGDLRSCAESLVMFFKLLHDIAKQNPDYNLQDK